MRDEFSCFRGAGILGVALAALLLAGCDGGSEGGSDCPAGTAGCPCLPGGECQGALVCESDNCFMLPELDDSGSGEEDAGVSAPVDNGIRAFHSNPPRLFWSMSPTGDCVVVDGHTGFGWEENGVYVIEVATGEAELVDVDSSGNHQPPGSSRTECKGALPASLPLSTHEHVRTVVSNSCNRVVFVSRCNYDATATLDETGVGSWVFLRDRAAGTTKLLSPAVDASGAPGKADTPTITGDGTQAMFIFHSDHSVFPSSTGPWDNPHEPFIVDLSPGGAPAWFGIARGTEGSWKVRDLTFTGDGGHLFIDAQPTDGEYSAAIVEVSGMVVEAHIPDAEGDILSAVTDYEWLDVSDSGRFVLWVQDDDTIENQIYLRDLQEDGIARLTSVGGVPFDPGPDPRPVISGNGQFVAYETGNLVAIGDESRFNPSQILRLDRATGETKLITASGEGIKSLSACTGAMINDDGTRIAFTCEGAGNLVEEESGRLFVWDELLDER